MHVTLDTLCLPRPIPESLFTLFLPFRSRDLPLEERGVGEPDTGSWDPWVPGKNASYLPPLRHVFHNLPLPPAD